MTTAPTASSSTDSSTIKGDWTIAFDGLWESAFTWEPQETPFDNPLIPGDVMFLEPRGSREAFSAYNLDSS